jgi:hypothetical protein
MRHDLSEIEYHNLFVNPIQSFRFAMEELTKMFECRLENLTKYICENELSATTHKTSRNEILRSIEGFRYSCEAVCETMKKHIERSLHKIEDVEGEK